MGPLQNIAVTLCASLATMTYFAAHTARAQSAKTDAGIPAKFSDPNCIDPDLKTIDESQSVTLCNGTLAKGTMQTLPTCASATQNDCVIDANSIAVDVTAIDANNIARGKTVGGIVGTMRDVKICRNGANFGQLDASAPSNLEIVVAAAAMNSGTTDEINMGAPHGLVDDTPVRLTTTGGLPPQLTVGTTYYVRVISANFIRLSATPGGALINFTTDGTGNHTFLDVSDGVASNYDTVSGNMSPNVAPWGAAYDCNSSNFTNVSTEVVPTGTTLTYASTAFTQVWRDNLSGMLVTNVLYDGSATTSWALGVQLCESLNGTSVGTGWYLPTIKELMQLYIDGIHAVMPGLGNTFWSSTTRSSYSALNTARNYLLSQGYGSYASNRSGVGGAVLCVRP